MADINPALRAYLDRELSGAVDGVLLKAAEHDGKDVIEANADLTGDLFALLSPPQLAAAAAALAIRLHRADAGKVVESAPLCRCSWLGAGTPAHVRTAFCPEVTG